MRRLAFLAAAPICFAAPFDVLADGPWPGDMPDRQSPINFTQPNGNPTPLSPLTFSYGNSVPVNAVHHVGGFHPGVEVFLTDNTSTVAVDGTTYRLKRFHFHHASEHSLGGNFHRMEVHMVHVALNGLVEDSKNVLVIGRWITIGNAHAELARVLPPLAYPLNPAVTDFNPQTLLPGPTDRRSWRYDGSLTTPHDQFEEDADVFAPARWIFFETPLTMTWPQINATMTRIGEPNVRGIQANHAAHNVVSDVPAPASVAVFILASLSTLRRRRSAAA